MACSPEQRCARPRRTSRCGAGSPASRWTSATTTRATASRPEKDNAPAGLHDALKATGYKLEGNLNTYAFDVNADAVATAVLTFGYDTSAVNGEVTPPHGPGKPKPPHKDVHGHAIR